MASFSSPAELHELFGVIEERQAPRPVFLQSFFSQNHFFETNTIDLDKISPDLRIATFVAAEHQATPTIARGYDTKIFNPGYWKDKGTIDLRNIRQRSAGEPFGRGAQNSIKFAREMQKVMTIIEDKRSRLMEWIAAEIMLFGKYTATSELHPPIEIDLERDIQTTTAALKLGQANQADLTAITDNGGAGKRIWGATGSTETVVPLTDLRYMMNSCDQPIESIIMADNAWELLIADSKSKDAISTQITSSSIFSVELLPTQKSMEGLKLRGVMGTTPIWTYSAQYQKTTDASSTLTKFLPDGYVIMMPSSSFGVKAFGAVEHAAANYAASEIFWNAWTEDESGVPWVQAQASITMLHTKMNSTAAWKVV